MALIGANRPGREIVIDERLTAELTSTKEKANLAQGRRAAELLGHCKRAISERGCVHLREHSPRGDSKGRRKKKRRRILAPATNLRTKTTGKMYRAQRELSHLEKNLTETT